MIREPLTPEHAQTHLQTHNANIPVFRASGHALSMHATPHARRAICSHTCTGVAPQRWHSNHTHTTSFDYETAIKRLLAQMSSTHTCVIELLQCAAYDYATRF